MLFELGLALALLDPPPPEPPCFVYALTQPCSMAPSQEAAMTAGRVWLGCESVTALMQPYGDPNAAVGAAGERSLAQIHPIHFGAMRRRGLSPNVTGDLITYAWVLVGPQADFSAWSCR